MPIVRCPQCNTPLTEAEARQGACPECAAPIEAPAAPPAKKRAETESSQIQSAFGCSVLVAIAGAIVLCLLPVGILFYVRPERTTPNEPHAVDPNAKQKRKEVAELKKPPVSDPAPKKADGEESKKLPDEPKKIEKDVKKSDEPPKKIETKKTEEPKKVEKIDVNKKPDPPPIPAVKRPRFANLPLLSDAAIKIDGDLSDWKNIPALKLTPLERGKATKKVVVAPAQVAGKAHVAYCSKGILIAVEVVDTSGAVEYKPKPATGDWDFWNNDAVEIYIDTLNTRANRRGEENAHQFFAFPLAAPKQPGVGGYESLILRKDGGESWKIVSHLNTGPSPMLSAGKKTSTGWTMEILIPKSALRRADIKPGQLFGFELQVDTGTNIYYHWANNDPLIRISTRPNLWGDVLFAGTDAVVDVVGADKKPIKTIAPGQPLTIRVGDADRNLDPANKEKVNVTVVSRSGDRKSIVLEETEANSGIFVGSMVTRLNTGKREETVFEILADDTISLEYLDLFRADGERDRLLRATLPVTGR